METALPAVIIIGLLLLAALVVTEQIFSSQDAVSASWREMQERAEERARTDLAPIGAGPASSGDGRVHVMAIQMQIASRGDVGPVGPVQHQFTRRPVAEDAAPSGASLHQYHTDL